MAASSLPISFQIAFSTCREKSPATVGDVDPGQRRDQLPDQRLVGDAQRLADLGHHRLDQRHAHLAAQERGRGGGPAPYDRDRIGDADGAHRIGDEWRGRAIAAFLGDVGEGALEPALEQRRGEDRRPRLRRASRGSSLSPIRATCWSQIPARRG